MPDILKRKQVTKEIREFNSKFGLNYSKLAKAMGYSRSTFYIRLQDHTWTYEDIKFLMKSRIIDEITL